MDEIDGRPSREAAETAGIYSLQVLASLIRSMVAWGVNPDSVLASLREGVEKLEPQVSAKHVRHLHRYEAMLQSAVDEGFRARPK